MQVREATDEDLEGIRAVAEASWERDYTDLLTRDTVASGVNDWYDESTLADQIAGERTPVLVAAGDSDGDGRSGVVGFAHGYADADVGHVLRLYVHPTARRAGTGEQLLSATVGALRDRGVDEVAATVLAANEQGRAFYESQGFEQVGGAEETAIGGETYPEVRYVLRADE